MSILSFALMQMATFELENQNRKDELMQRWHESKNLPRKEKKKVRKHLNLMYSILSYQSKMFEI